MFTGRQSVKEQAVSSKREKSDVKFFLCLLLVDF